MSIVGSEVGNRREHELVQGGLGTLYGKVGGESDPPGVQAFKV